MFAFKIAVLSAIASSAFAGSSSRFERKVHRNVPQQFEERGYAQDADLLEPYEQYNERYMNFHCYNAHGTPFFDSCCHPRLKEHNEDDFADVCYDECPEGEDSGESSAPATLAPTGLPSSSKTPIASTKKPERAQSSAPAPTPTPAPATSTKKADPPKATSKAPSNDGGSSSGGSFNLGGFATYFTQGGNAGACGKVHSDNDLIAAIDIERYGDTGRASSLCGKKVNIMNTKNSKSVTVTIADVCPTCKNGNSIDLSVGAFKALGALSEGMLDIKWQYV